MKVVSHLFHGVVFAVACSLLAPPSALADSSEAVSLLTSHGGLKKREARKVVSKVAARMAESADNFAPADDPLRVALSQSLFGTDIPENSMKAAKVRLKLFAGPSAWSFKAMFAPGGGQIAGCQKTFELSKSQCEALVAAGGQVSVADARDAEGSGARVASSAAPQAESAAPAAAPRKSRFARYDSGFRGSAAQPSRAAAPAARASTPSRFSRPAQASAKARPTAAPSKSGMSTREAYLARRQAYLDRQKARMDEAKAKQAEAVAAKASSAPPAVPAAIVDAPSSTAGKGGDSMEISEAEAAGGAPAAAEAPAPAANTQLSGDFLSDLLSDPLGGK